MNFIDFLENMNSTNFLMNINITDMFATFQQPTPDGTKLLVKQIATLVICVFGFIGNSTTAIVYFSKNMRHLSCSIYLGIRAVFDNGRILTVFVDWLDFFDIRVIHVPGLCQIMLFLSYLCSFVSVWCVVLITRENFILICRPGQESGKCRLLRERQVVVFTVLIGTVFYTFPLWGMTVKDIGGVEYCVIRDGEIYLNLESALIYIDTVVTLIIPMVTIIVLMVNITKSFYRSHKRMSKRRAARDRNMFLEARPNFQAPPHTKATKLLSTVSVCFLFFHTPVHVLRLKLMIENLLHIPHVVTEMDRDLHQAFSVVYNLNFAVNWLIYFISGSKFRRVFCKRFFRCCTATFDRYVMIEFENRNIQ